MQLDCVLQQVCLAVVLFCGSCPTILLWVGLGPASMAMTMPLKDAGELGGDFCIQSVRSSPPPPSPFPSPNCEVAAPPRRGGAATWQFGEGKGEGGGR